MFRCNRTLGVFGGLGAIVLGAFVFQIVSSVATIAEGVPCTYHGACFLSAWTYEGNDVWYRYDRCPKTGGGESDPAFVGETMQNRGGYHEWDPEVKVDYFETDDSCQVNCQGQQGSYPVDATNCKSKGDKVGQHTCGDCNGC